MADSMTQGQAVGLALSVTYQIRAIAKVLFDMAEDDLPLNDTNSRREMSVSDMTALKALLLEQVEELEDILGGPFAG